MVNPKDPMDLFDFVDEKGLASYRHTAECSGYLLI
jgi:hypothetical protein